MSYLNLLELDPLHLSIGQAFSDHPAGIKLIALVSYWIEEGHVCLCIDQLETKDKVFIEELIDSCPPSLISFQESEVATPLYYLHGNLYLHKTYRAETLFIEELYRFLHTFKTLNSLSYEPDPLLAPLQNEALKKALSPGMLILTGGPGTGKTFTAKKIAEELIKKSSFFKPSLILAAPTSKALDQLKKSVGPLEGVEIIADTLHKLIGFFSRKPAYLKASCVIIDEASMIEAPVMAKLFACLGSEAKVILMGDPHQLPPVGLGSFFQDLLSSISFLPYCHHVHLTQPHRCHEGAINQLKELTHQAEAEEFLSHLDQDHPHLKLIRQPLESYDKKVFETLCLYFKEEILFLDDLFFLNSHKTLSIILSTLRQGPLGVDAINHELRQYFSLQSLAKRYYIEPIMLLETDKDLALFNGQTGFKIHDRL
jgi:exodeoxyribonuclease V alpha subunit